MSASAAAALVGGYLAKKAIGLARERAGSYVKGALLGAAAKGISRVKGRFKKNIPVRKHAAHTRGKRAVASHAKRARNTVSRARGGANAAPKAGPYKPGPPLAVRAVEDRIHTKVPTKVWNGSSIEDLPPSIVNTVIQRNRHRLK